MPLNKIINKLILIVCTIYFSFSFIMISISMYYENFNSNSDFDICKSEVENYLKDVQRYVKCITDEAEDNINKAVKEQNEVIRKFNCKASGKSYCY